MKIGTENRKQLILASSLGVVALGALIYTLAGSSSPDATPSASAPPATLARPVPSPSSASAAARAHSSALDPTLHPEGMELTEQLVYSGSGRNIFSTSSAPATARTLIPAVLASPRNQPPVTAPVSMGPPPIDLRFFGTATKANGSRQAFFLRGDDVFLASEGDVVGRRYKVGPIAANSVEVTDMTNDNRQRLPLATQ